MEVDTGVRRQEMAENVPPIALPVLAENIPQELKERLQWVAWTWKLTEGSWTKVPVDPASGRWADATKPDTWDTFEAALDHARIRELPGVGYVRRVRILN
jgi:primase-polymerase (primpol)-like protein